MPEPTPLRLSSAEDRLRSGVSAGLLGESAEVARGEPGLLEEISPGPPRAGGAKSPETALAGRKTAAGESCKQQLGSLPSTEFQSVDSSGLVFPASCKQHPFEIAPTAGL